MDAGSGDGEKVREEAAINSGSPFRWDISHDPLSQGPWKETSGKASDLPLVWIGTSPFSATEASQPRLCHPDLLGVEYVLVHQQGPRMPAFSVFGVAYSHLTISLIFHHFIHSSKRFSVVW